MLHQFVTVEPKKPPIEPRQYLQKIQSTLHNKRHSAQLEKKELLNLKSKLIPKNITSNMTPQTIAQELQGFAKNMTEIIYWLDEMESLLKNLDFLDDVEVDTLLKSILPIERTIKTLDDKQSRTNIIKRAHSFMRRSSDTDSSDDDSDDDSGDDRKGSSKTVAQVMNNGAIYQDSTILSSVSSTLDPTSGHVLYSMPNSPQGSTKQTGYTSPIQAIKDAASAHLSIRKELNDMFRIVTNMHDDVWSSSSVYTGGARPKFVIPNKNKADLIKSIAKLEQEIKDLSDQCQHNGMLINKAKTLSDLNGLNPMVHKNKDLLKFNIDSLRTSISMFKSGGGGGGGGGAKPTMRASRVGGGGGGGGGGGSSSSSSTTSGGSFSGSTKTNSPNPIWEYQDNDGLYYEYNIITSQQINDEIQKGNFNKNNDGSTKTFKISVQDKNDSTYTHTFDVYLDDENNGSQSGNLKARHIRRKGTAIIRPTTPSSSTTLSSSTTTGSQGSSKTSSFIGNAQQKFQNEIWQGSESCADWFENRLKEKNIFGQWEYNNGQDNWPFEMVHNRPPDSASLNNQDLWEYSDFHFPSNPEAYDARRHVYSGMIGINREFVGFFRLTDVRCGLPKDGLVTHTLKNVDRLRSTKYPGIKMNILYHASKKQSVVQILTSRFMGAYSQTGVYGKGTYFAMGPHVDYCMGNSIFRNAYDSWKGNKTDSYGYIIVSHAATRPSKDTSDVSSMNNGFNYQDSEKYITGGNVANAKGNNGVLMLQNREIVYGDKYNRDKPNSACPVEELIFPIGVAVFKIGK